MWLLSTDDSRRWHDQLSSRQSRCRAPRLERQQLTSPVQGHINTQRYQQAVSAIHRRALLERRVESGCSTDNEHVGRQARQTDVLAKPLLTAAYTTKQTLGRCIRCGCCVAAELCCCHGQLLKERPERQNRCNQTSQLDKANVPASKLSLQYCSPSCMWLSLSYSQCFTVFQYEQISVPTRSLPAKQVHHDTSDGCELSGVHGPSQHANEHGNWEVCVRHGWRRTHTVWYDGAVLE